MRRLHALSIDVEEWYHAELVRARVPAESRVSQALEATTPILQLLARYGAKATFFVVGEVAQACPKLVREIVRQGHELGCHGFSHRPLWEMTPAILAQELREYQMLMREIIGAAVELAGFRAPTFSLDVRTAWAVDVLAEFGYRYDSSVFPCKTYLYGVANAPDTPYRLSSADVSRPDPAGRLIEFPMSVCRIGGVRIPVSGGAYLRLLPMPVLEACLRRIERERPFVLYVHPWEVYPKTPKVSLPLRDSLVTYHNRDGVLKKLERLITRFDLAPLRVVLAQYGWLD